MIKFKALIHKETGTVIKYEDWLTGYKKDFVCTMPTSLKAVSNYIEDCTKQEKPKTYFMRNIIFNDDFEIIYDSEFTVDELYSLYGLSGDLKGKIEKLILNKKKFAIKYGIEV